MPLSQVWQEQSHASYSNLSKLVYTAPPTSLMQKEVQTGTSYSYYSFVVGVNLSTLALFCIASITVFKYLGTCQAPIYVLHMDTPVTKL